MGQKTESSILLPQRISMTITTNADINSKNLNRYLVFKNFLNKEIRLKFTLNTEGNNKRKLIITDFPDSTHELQLLGSMNYRSYWDQIYLANINANTTIAIKSITLMVHYIPSSNDTIRDIPLLDNVIINQNLAKNQELFLTPYIEKCVTNWAGILPTDHIVAQLAANDIGKSGTASEGFDQFGDNPKYRGWLSYECSEFVSWYLHAAYSMNKGYNGFSTNAFKHITYTQQIHDLFKTKNKSFEYNLAKKSFVNESDKAIKYIPKAGDVLIRRGNGKAEHSMILVKWNSKTLIATVIDGPYVVTLREVNVHSLETNTENPKDFVLCSV